MRRNKAHDCSARGNIAHCSRVVASQGVKHGDRVVVEASNSAMTVVLIHAVNMAGGCFIPVHPSTPTEQRAYIAQDAGAVLILSAKIRDLDCRDHLRTRRCARSRRSQIRECGYRQRVAACFDPDRRKKNDLACMNLKRRDRERAVRKASPVRIARRVCSRRNCRGPRLPRGDRIFCAIPLSFDYGLYQVFLALGSGLYALSRGSRQSAVWDCSRRSSKAVPTCLPAVPLMIETLSRIGQAKARRIAGIRPHQRIPVQRLLRNQSGSW